jgi:hypothetical protein
MSKLPHTEGTWFAVPLRDGGYGVGVVSRVAPKGPCSGHEIAIGPRSAMRRRR